METADSTSEWREVGLRSLAPAPLSQWQSDLDINAAGLILDFANAFNQTVDGDCQRLLKLIANVAPTIKTDFCLSPG